MLMAKEIIVVFETSVLEMDPAVPALEAILVNHIVVHE